MASPLNTDPLLATTHAWALPRALANTAACSHLILGFVANPGATAYSLLEALPNAAETDLR